MRIAVFPGSFDPITIGHADILRRALPLFDKIVIAIGTNSSKKYLFSAIQRKEFITTCFANDAKIEVADFTGLTAHFCQQIDAKFILRGVRSAADFEYERSIAHLNTALNQNLDPVLLVCSPQYSHISSTMTRDVLQYGGDASSLLPPEIKDLIQNTLGK